MRIAESEGAFDGFPPAALKKMGEGQDRDPLVFSPSSATDCLRKKFLLRESPYWLVPEKRWALTVGNALHAMFDEGGEHNEQRIQLKLPNDVIMSGQPDKYDAARRCIVDYKTVSSFDYYDGATKQRKRLGNEAKKEHQIQVNLYKLLLERNGFPVERAEVWYVRTTKEATRRLVPVKLWPLDVIEELATVLSEPLRVYKETGELPQAYTPDEPDYWRCGFCEVRRECSRLVMEGL